MRAQVLNELSETFPVADVDIPGFGRVSRRALSIDPETGAETSRVVLPPGFTAPRSYFGANLELFVLRGALAVGVHSMREYTYGYLPAGITSGPWTATEETEILWMPDATLEATASDTHLPGAHHLQYVPAKDFDATPWSSTITPGFYPGAMRKSLRTDPVTGSDTWLLGVLPGQHDHRMEVHPVIEEAYVLETSEPDRDTVGLYLYRDPHVFHGPYHSRHFALTFFRTHGGPLVTNYITPRGESEAYWTPA